MKTTKDTKNTESSENPAKRDLSEVPCCALLRAAIKMDWKQVHLHGGKPCFYVEDDGYFCGRSERWHGHEITHNYVSLYDLLWDVMTRPQEEVIIPEINHAEAVAKILSHNSDIKRT